MLGPPNHTVLAFRFWVERNRIGRRRRVLTRILSEKYMGALRETPASSGQDTEMQVVIVGSGRADLVAQPRGRSGCPGVAAKVGLKGVGS